MEEKNTCSRIHMGKVKLFKIDITKILMTNGSLMKVESIAEYSKGSILQFL